MARYEIVCTHTHIDHVGAIFELQQKAGVRAAIHKADLFLFEKLDVQAQWLDMRSSARTRTSTMWAQSSNCSRRRESARRFTKPISFYLRNSTFRRNGSA